MAELAAVVLAAGASRRMGRPKAALEWQGQALLQHQLDVLASVDGMGEIVVVSGHAADLIDKLVATWRPRAPETDVCVCFNPDHATSKASSVKTGVAALPPGRAVVIAALDQPLSGGVVGALARALPNAGAICIPVHGGRRGHPVLFGAGLRSELLAVCDADAGMRAVVRRLPERIVEVEADSDEIHLNLNTPEAWARARNRS